MDCRKICRKRNWSRLPIRKKIFHSPEKAKRSRLCSSSQTVIRPPVWHSTLPFSRQIDTAEARSFSEFWNKSRQAFSSFLMGVENGVFQEDKIPSLAAIFEFRLRALSCLPLTKCLAAQFLARVQSRNSGYESKSWSRGRSRGFSRFLWP